MNDSIQSTLDPKDTLLWQGRPNPSVSGMNLMIMVAVALGISAILYFLYGPDPLGSTALTGKTAAYGVMGIAAFMALVGRHSNSRTEFAITKRKGILKTGISGTRFVTVNLEDIKEVTVDIGPVQGRFFCGTLGIDSGKTETVSERGRIYKDNLGRTIRDPDRIQVRKVIDSFTDIDNPHEVHRILMEAIEKRKMEPTTENRLA